MGNVKSTSEEIDLRLLLTPLLKHWNILAAIVLLAEFCAIGANLFTVPTQYAAESLVLLRQVDYMISPNQYVVTDYNRAEMSLATVERFAISDRVMQAALTELLAANAKFVGLTIQDFRKDLSVNKIAASNNLLGLEVVADDAAISALVANTWARVLIREANTLFTVTDQTHVDAERAQSEQIAQNLSVLQSRLNQVDPNSAEAIQLKSDINAQQALYESLRVAVGFAESGLGQRFEVQIASESSVPTFSVGRRLVLLIIVTAISSITVGAVIVVGVSLWSRSENGLEDTRHH